MRESYVRAALAGRHQVSRRMLDDPELRAVHAEFKRRQYAQLAELTAWQDWLDAVETN